MPFLCDAKQLEQIECLLLKEMEGNGKIMIRSLDKIHARTGLTYATVSEIARRLQERGFRRGGV